MNILRRLLCATVCMSSFTTAVVLAEETYELNIDEQALPAALATFAEQSGLQIIYFAAVAEGARTKGIAGVYSADAALTELLAETELEFTAVDERTYSVKSATADANEESVPGKSRPTPSPIVMAQTSATRIPNQTHSHDGNLPGTVSGRVKGEGSHRSFIGALVTIVETGQSAATDDLGGFRFSSVMPGSYTVRVSYLGFADGRAQLDVSSGEKVWRDFVLGQALEEIVVYGSRSARALALNQERTAANVSTVLSADLLGNFTGTTLSEALRRASGVAFQRDSGTGDGTNIIVRGLSPDFNGIQLNGLNLPVGNGQDRAANLGNMLVDSVDTITINKTLLPSHDSAGTGGLVQIETKSPLGRAPRTANFTVEGGRRAKGFGDDFLLSSMVSGIFGEQENFGLSASVQYREASNQSVSYGTNLVPGLALPLDPSGGTEIDSPRLIDPRTQFPFEPGIDQFYVESGNTGFVRTDSTTLAVTLAGEWQIADHTRLKLDLQRSTRKHDNFASNLTVQGRSSTAGPFGGGSIYQLLPVQALNGDVRQALALDGGVDVRQNYFATKDQEGITDTFSFRGATDSGKWNFDYTAGYTRGSFSVPGTFFVATGLRDPVASAFLLAAATDPVEGRVISPFDAGGGPLLPLLNDAGFAAVNNPANTDLTFADFRRNEGENDRYTGKFSGKYDFDLPQLKYIEIGVNFETAKFSSLDSSTSYFSNLPAGPPFFFPPNPSLDSLGLGLADESSLADIGIDRGLRFISEDSLMAFARDIGSFAGGPASPLVGFDIPTHPLQRDAFLKEDELAIYAQARVDVGRLEIIGGARFSQVKVTSAHLIAPRLFDEFFTPDIAFGQEFTQLADVSVTETNVLPRIVANYRYTDNLVLRGGYFVSVARPQVSDLSTTQSISLSEAPSFGPTRNQPSLTISEGNPDLKPSRTDNFDISLEYYDDNIGVIKVGGFYKRIDNLLENNAIFGDSSLAGVTLPDHPAFQNITAANTFITRTRPLNNNSSASIWGVEIQAERQFTFLPGIWAGLGVFANYTYSKSSKELNVVWDGSPVLDANGDFTFAPNPFNPFGPPTVVTEAVTLTYGSVPFDQQPKHSGTVALTYNQYNIDAALTYGFQSRIQEVGFGFASAGASFGLVPYNESVETLDFRAEYQLERLSGVFRFYVEALDMLRGVKDVDLERSLGRNANRRIVGGTYLGGRSIRLGMTASF